jgi:hypothetical protein
VTAGGRQGYMSESDTSFERAGVYSGSVNAIKKSLTSANLGSALCKSQGASLLVWWHLIVPPCDCGGNDCWRTGDAGLGSLSQRPPHLARVRDQERIDLVLRLGDPSRSKVLHYPVLVNRVLRSFGALYRIVLWRHAPPISDPHSASENHERLTRVITLRCFLITAGIRFEYIFT